MRRTEEEKTLATKRVNLLLLVVNVALLVYLVFCFFK